MEHIFPKFIFYNIFFNKLIFTFIWSSPVHRVKKELLQKDFCEGGLKMINLNLFILALKTTTVIFPMTVRFLFDHILISFFICKILSL
jgi:hypothetical protein